MKCNSVKMLIAATFISIGGAAQAAHESSNRFDFKPAANETIGDGKGVSNYVSGASTPNNELWNSQIQVSGLLPRTVYTF